MKSLRRLPRAVSDLDSIWLYIAQDDPIAAERLIERISALTNRLSDHPYLGPAKPDIALDMRTLSVGRYIILYRVTSDAIDLVRVVHGARDLGQIDLD